MKIKYYIVSLATALFLNSCFKLEQEPYNDLSQKKAFESVHDAQFWVNGMYNELRENIHGKAMYATDIQAGYLHKKRSFAENEADDNLYNWSLFNTSNETIASIWKNYFAAIQNINIALDGIPTIRLSTNNSSEVTAVRRHMGELYLARAIYYTYLVTHYCPTYNETSSYGLPIMDHFIDGELPLRSSVKETYDFILADIARAQEHLADVGGRVGKDTFTKDAVTALKARVLLYKGDWEGAYTAATSLIATNTYPLTTTENALKQAWATDATSESITLLYARYDQGVKAELPQGNSIYLGEEKDFYGRVRYYRPKFVPTQDFVDLFANGDFRKNVYINKLFVNYSDLRYNNIYLVTKYPDNDALKNSSGDEGTYLHRPKVFRIAEQYLIAAEAAYRKGDDTNAQLYLNRLRNSRGLTTAITATGNTLFTEIQNERNRELAFEGFRLYDIKRWGLGIVRGTPQNEQVIVTTDPANTYQLNVPAGDNKLTWPIPATNIRYENGRWQQNPGW